MMQEMFKPLLDVLDSAGYDFFPLDSLQWGNFDHLVVIHSGYPADYGDPTDGCTADSKDRIWSQGIAATANGWLSADTAYSVSTYALIGAFNGGLCEGNPVEMGLISHEYMHGFGLIDLYDRDEAEERLPIGGTGRFSIMSNLYGWYVARFEGFH